MAVEANKALVLAVGMAAMLPVKADGSTGPMGIAPPPKAAEGGAGMQVAAQLAPLD